MKQKILSLLFVAITVTATTVQPVHAQVNVNINIGSQPVWGPTGYDYAQNYYLPEVDVFYSVGGALFYFLSGGRWVSGRALPPQYGNLDLYNTYKVVVNQPQPWRNAATFRSQYSSYRTRHNQPIIRDSRDQRYYANPQHPMHSQWNGQNTGSHSNDGRARDNRRSSDHRR